MKTIIIGCGSTGSSLAKRLFKRNVPLHLISRTEDSLKLLASEVKATYDPVDVFDDAKLKSALEAASKEGCSGLVYTAGSIMLKPFKNHSLKDFQDTIHLNMIAPARAIQHAFNGLQQSGAASVVLFSTVAARQGFPSHAAIASAKGGVEALTRSLAAELSPKVRVNCIAPSLTDTKMAQFLTKNEKVKESLASMHPIPRIGVADDLSALADFLLNPELSGWITGQVISVDGGRSTLRPKN